MKKALFMRILLKPIVGLLLGFIFASPTATGQDSRDCLYNDTHFHIQDFKADGPPLRDILKMMDAHVCRSVLMGLPATVAHDPLIDRDFAPVYYTQTDAQAVYYNAIQDVLVAHKFLSLPEADRARVDPLMRTIEALALAIEAKDHTTHDHLQRVRVYAIEVAKELRVSAEEMEALQAAALLHDIGKLAVPEHIISKPGRLTP